MSQPARSERFEIRITATEDPLPDATFGSIGRHVQGSPSRRAGRAFRTSPSAPPRPA
jgi:hypothetical protein